MLRSNLPRAMRHLRRRRGWRQTDLADRAGTSRHVVSRIERGLIRRVSLGRIDALAEALGASVDLTVRWQGERLDRLLDRVHAATQERAAASLRVRGWLTEVEVSFNHYGDRGRVDVLAYHSASGCLLVAEVKSAVGDVQETLGRIDVKARLGRSLAASAGWTDVRAVVPALILTESRTSRRVIAAHPVLFARYSVRGRAAQAWLRRPTFPAPSGLLWFVELPDAHGVRTARRQSAAN
jgi:transcriptional regulator with XRE-family HTH domain